MNSVAKQRFTQTQPGIGRNKGSGRCTRSVTNESNKQTKKKKTRSVTCYHSDFRFLAPSPYFPTSPVKPSGLVLKVNKSEGKEKTLKCSASINHSCCAQKCALISSSRGLRQVYACSVTCTRWNFKQGGGRSLFHVNRN